MFSGGQIGTVVGMPVSGLLCMWWGWESVFYFFGENCPFFYLLLCPKAMHNFAYILRKTAQTLHIQSPFSWAVSKLQIQLISYVHGS